MKAIISHDIDHITVWEHLLKDAIIPKFIIRSKIELLTGKISINEYMLRFADLFKNKWQNINELIEFNQANAIASSFFIGVQNGLGLSYSKETSALWINKMLSKNCEVGVHGIEFDSLENIKKEYDIFQALSSLTQFGTRMHYVRKNEQTFSSMAQVGYKYDSTEHSFKNPYKIGAMWEFPFQIMDGWIIEKGKRWQTQTIHQAKENTKQLIDQAFSANLNYLGIDFHDRYFSQSFKTWIDWYVWLINYLKENNIEFVNFRQAIIELENKPKN